MIEKRLGMREARVQFADLLERVKYDGEIIIVERRGKPVAVMISPDLYRILVAQRKARFVSLDRLRARLPDASEAEVRADVEEAVDAVRSACAGERS